MQTLSCGCTYDDSFTVRRCKAHLTANLGGVEIIVRSLETERDSMKDSLVGMAANDQCGGEGGGDEWEPCADKNCASCQAQVGLDRARELLKEKASSGC